MKRGKEKREDILCHLERSVGEKGGEEKASALFNSLARLTRKRKKKKKRRRSEERPWNLAEQAL